MTEPLFTFAILNDQLYLLAKRHNFEPVKFQLTFQADSFWTSYLLEGQSYILVPETLPHEGEEAMALKMLEALLAYNDVDEVDIGELLEEIL